MTSVVTSLRGRRPAPSKSPSPSTRTRSWKNPEAAGTVSGSPVTSFWATRATPSLLRRRRTSAGRPATTWRWAWKRKERETFLLLREKTATWPSRPFSNPFETHEWCPVPVTRQWTRVTLPLLCSTAPARALCHPRPTARHLLLRSRKKPSPWLEPCPSPTPATCLDTWQPADGCSSIGWSWPQNFETNTPFFFFFRKIKNSNATHLRTRPFRLLYSSLLFI